MRVASGGIRTHDTCTYSGTCIHNDVHVQCMYVIDKLQSPLVIGYGYLIRCRGGAEASN